MNLSQVITLGNPFRMERALALQTQANSPKAIDSSARFQSPESFVSEKTESDNQDGGGSMQYKARYSPSKIKQIADHPIEQGVVS